MKADEYVVERLLKIEQEYEMAKSRSENLANENKELNEVLSIIKKYLNVKDGELSFFIVAFADKKADIERLTDFFGLDFNKGE